MKLWQVDHAVNDMCREVKSHISFTHWYEMGEDSILRELIICILGSGVRYELAVTYTDAILDAGLNFREANLDSLTSELYSILSSSVFSTSENRQYRKYRYPTRGANHVSKSVKNILSNHKGIRSLLYKDLDTRSLRKIIIDTCPGIGPKQSSHFLKNIGYTEDVAVLDRHIVRYLEIADKREIRKESLSRLDHYELLEKRFQKVTKKFSYSPSIVDQAMWFIMRGIGNEAIT